MQRLPEDSPLRQALDTFFFPLRALFVHQNSTPLLTSLRDERMRAVRRHCRGRVLDVGCGPHNLFIRDFYPNGIGVDVFPYEGLAPDQIVEDPCRLPFADDAFDCVTLIGVGGHIPRSIRAAEFREFARVTKPQGRLIMTEGEPITQYILHKWVHAADRAFGTRWDLDGQRGMHDEEEYCMARSEILELFAQAGFALVTVDYFQWKLNHVYVGENAKR